MILHQVPVVRAEARPVIKMKWAADPMVPFRQVEHWPRDLYLIDQPVQREKKFLSSREACSPLHCSISEQMKKERNALKLCWLFFLTGCGGIILSSEDKRETSNSVWGTVASTTYLINMVLNAHCSIKHTKTLFVLLHQKSSIESPDWKKWT